MRGLVSTCAAVATTVALAQQSTLVDIPGQGKVQGAAFESEGYLSWLGVPYAADTSGANRFRPPSARPSWSSVIDATKYGPGCPSIHHNPDVPAVTSEDCLNVNIYTPTSRKSGELVPVGLFFYGGSFAEEANYRLGALGNIVIGQEGSGADGNQDILDQRFVMQWVQKNIALFGGDPQAVTIWGESAGAMSVGIHIVSPGSQGLFRGAIQESNPVGMMYRNTSGASLYGATFCVDAGCQPGGATAQCDMDCLRKQPLDVIQKAWDKASGNIEDYILSDWGHLLDGILQGKPTVDGDVLPGEPVTLLNEAKNANVSLMQGYNHGEGPTFIYDALSGPLECILYSLALDVVLGFNDSSLVQKLPAYSPTSGNFSDCRPQFSQMVTDWWFGCGQSNFARAAKRSGSRAFVYRYDHVFSGAFVFPKFGLPDICEHVACHASELPFVFGQDVPQLNATFTPDEVTLTRRMMAYWASFIKHQDPSVERLPGAPEWPDWDETNQNILVLNAPDVAVSNMSQLCHFWDGIGYEH